MIFRLGYRIETALVTLVEYLDQEMDRGSINLLIFLDLSVAYDTTDNGPPF